MKTREIGGIGNYEGGILIAEEEDGKYFWTLDGYDSTPLTEIPKKLYDALVEYDSLREFSTEELRFAEYLAATAPRKEEMRKEGR